MTLVEKSRNGKGCIALSWLPGGLLPEPCFTLTLLSSVLPSDRDSRMVVSRLLSVSFQLSLASGSHGGGSWGVDKSRAWVLSKLDVPRGASVVALFVSRDQSHF